MANNVDFISTIKGNTDESITIMNVSNTLTVLFLMIHLFLTL